MTREHLINSILSAVFPSGSIPLASVLKVPRILTLVDELVDEVGADDNAAELALPLRASDPAAPGGASADGIDWDNEPRLGVVGDTVLAKELGVTAVTVLTARRKRGLASPVSPIGRKPKVEQPTTTNEQKRPPGVAKGVDWDAEPRLGQVADTVLAAEYGVVSQTVFNARKKRGIPAWTPKDTRTAEAEDRKRELDAIEDHIKTKGVTKVTARYVEPDSIPANPKGRGGLV